MNKYVYHIAYICPTACVLYSTYRPNITAHVSKIDKKMQLKSTMLLPYMCE